MIDNIMNSISNLPWWLGIPLFSLVAIAMAFLPFFSLRWVFEGKLDGDVQSMATSIIVRLGTLHALILALVFAQELLNYSGVRQSNLKEAAATADAYYELKRWSSNLGESIEHIEDSLADYISVVVGEEWCLLANGQLSPRAWELYDEIELSLLGLQPTTEAQHQIWLQVMEDWDTVSEYRRAREMAANYRVPGFFWAIAIVGFFLVALPYFVFEPKGANLCTLAAFAAYNGIILFFIISIANPFSGSIPLQPDTFERLFAEDMLGRLSRLAL